MAASISLNNSCTVVNRIVMVGSSGTTVEGLIPGVEARVEGPEGSPDAREAI